MDSPDKSLVKTRFRRGLPTYSEAAEVQRTMAHRLAERIRSQQTQFHSVLEIGVGTGALTDLLDRSIRWDRRVVNDLVEECRPFHAGRRNTEFLAGDAETIEWSAGSFDLICSNAVFQWLSDLPSFLRKLYRATAPGGLLAFSTFGPDNFNELASLTGRGLRYYTRDELTSCLAEAGYERIRCSEAVRIRPFQDPMEVLRLMRRTGVSASGARHGWTPRKLADFCREYKARFSLPDDRVRLTWHPVYVLAVRSPRTGQE